MFYVGSVAQHKLPKLQAGFQSNNNKTVVKVFLTLKICLFKYIFNANTQNWGMPQLLEPSDGAFVVSVNWGNINEQSLEQQESTPASPAGKGGLRRSPRKAKGAFVLCVGSC